ncbi:hypothetical protein WI88_13405 [Burkholderia ubonensis]|nr:hypothetical protein WI88_13405 [Burkholderia ubonensis]
MTLTKPLDLTQEGYIGSLPITEEDWFLAEHVAHARMSATSRRGRQVPRDPAAQYWLELKGAIAEVTFNGYMFDLLGAGHYSEDELGISPLVHIRNDDRPDLVIRDSQFDIKGSSALVPGRSIRNDRYITISQSKVRGYTVQGYTGLVLGKSYADVLDVFMYRIAGVYDWETGKAANARTGDYYKIAIPEFEPDAVAA